MKILGFFVLAPSMAVATTAAADPVVDAFYNRCVSENAYQMAPNELEGACMAPVIVSFLTDDARRRVEDAIRNNTPVSLGARPFEGNPADLARGAIQQCPSVGKAMYAQEMRRRQRGRAAVPGDEGHDRSGRMIYRTSRLNRGPT